MDPVAIIQRTKSLITRPNSEWRAIKNEDFTMTELYMKYVIILAAIPAVAGAIGFSLFGGLGSGIVWAILYYAVSLAGVYFTSLIIDSLAPYFQSNQNLGDTAKVVVFSLFPAWLSGIFYLIPLISILSALVSLYGLYLMFLGLKIVKEPTKEKALPYFVVSMVIVILVHGVMVSMISSIIFGS